MSAGAYNFCIEQGIVFTRILSWKKKDGTPIDLTGWTGRMQIRSPEGTLIITLSESDGITIDGPAGTVTLFIDDSTTTGFTFTEAKYDLKLFNPDAVPEVRLVEGTVTVSPQTTV